MPFTEHFADNFSNRLAEQDTRLYPRHHRLGGNERIEIEGAFSNSHFPEFAGIHYYRYALKVSREGGENGRHNQTSPGAQRQTLRRFTSSLVASIAGGNQENTCRCPHNSRLSRRAFYI